MAKRPFHAKQGEHGTLYRYEVTYRNIGDDMSLTTNMWAYDVPHVEDKFFSAEDGWEIVGIKRLREPVGGFSQW